MTEKSKAPRSSMARKDSEAPVVNSGLRKRNDLEKSRGMGDYTAQEAFQDQ